MTRLIDADALLEDVKELKVIGHGGEYIPTRQVIDRITNAPTVQREGWVSVEDLQRLYDDMFRHKDIAISANLLFKLIQAAPTDTE